MKSIRELKMERNRIDSLIQKRKVIEILIENFIDDTELSIDYGIPFEIGREIINGRVYTSDQTANIEIKLTISKKELGRIMEGL